MRYLLGTVLLTAATTCFAQSAVDVGRAEQGRRTLTLTPSGPAQQTEGSVSSNLNSPEIPATQGDSDLGQQWILKRMERTPSFFFSGGVDGFYTNNVALTRNGTQDTGFLHAHANASWLPQITPNLKGELSFEQATFRYADFGALDFDSQTFTAGLTAYCPHLPDVSFFARYGYIRLLNVSSYDEFFTEHTFTLGFQKVWRLTQSHYFYAGWASQFDIAHPVNAQRDEHGAFVGYHINLTRCLAADVYYRSAYYVYNQASRNDWNNLASATLSYQVTSWLTANASVSYAFNRSDKSVFDYAAFNGGGGVYLNASF